MNETEVICRLCLEIIKKPLPIDKMTEEIIGLLMLKLMVDVHEPLIAGSAYHSGTRHVLWVCRKLSKKPSISRRPASTEDCLYPFIEGKSEAGLDLRDIYLKVNDKENVESVKEREVCRFCMKSNDSGLYTPVDVIEENVEIKKLLENYLPEVVMGVIEKPVACENCLTFLRHYSLFVTRFSNVEQQIQAYAKKTLERDYVGAIDLRQVKGFSLSNVTKSKLRTKKKIIPEEKIKCEEKEINESKISMVSPETERREQEEFDSFARSNELFRSNQIPDVEKAQADIEMKRSFLEPIETEVKRTCHEEDVSHIEKVKGEAEKCQRSLSSHKIDDCQELEACLGIKLMEFEIKKEDNEYDGNKNNTLILIGPGMIYSKDAEMKPTVVYMSYNPEANHTGIETGP
ncbi:hypothetical protein NQ318_000041 [Aromia moschata]|uniref:ZAD domain-containing protein n=1 Tax=Aromia moschata TaxID=1265417 RepID=A0AAV8YC85_9CUCU|nr:hypothetical protein NQ318_000041 [Aromia moschata]